MPRLGGPRPRSSASAAALCWAHSSRS